MSKLQRTWALLVPTFSLVAACGGTAKEAETPPEPPPEAALEDTTAATGNEPDDTIAEETSEPGASDEPASPQDFQEALQVMIQDEALQNAMNLTEPGRFPIKISGSDLPSNLDLTAGTKAVEIVEAPEDPKSEPVLVFSKIEISSTKAVFRYRYDIEGVRGTTTVKKNGDVWELKASRISKY